MLQVDRGYHIREIEAQPLLLLLKNRKLLGEKGSKNIALPGGLIDFGGVFVEAALDGFDQALVREQDKIGLEVGFERRRLSEIEERSLLIELHAILDYDRIDLEVKIGMPDIKDSGLFGRSDDHKCIVAVVPGLHLLGSAKQVDEYLKSSSQIPARRDTEIGSNGRSCRNQRRVVFFHLLVVGRPRPIPEFGQIGLPVEINQQRREPGKRHGIGRDFDIAGAPGKIRRSRY